MVMISTKHLLYFIIIVFIVLLFIQLFYKNNGFKSVEAYETINKNKGQFFFIHNYKVMGTTIYDQLPINYKKKFYGNKSVEAYERENNKKFPKLKKKFPKNKVSIDHLPLDKLLEYDILLKDDIQKLNCIGFVRDSIERFLSICNFEKKSPSKIISEIKNGRELRQSVFFKHKYPWKIDIYHYHNKSGIKNWFKKYNIYLNLDMKKNVSKNKLYSKKNISVNETQFLNEYFKEDEYIIAQSIKS